MKKTTKQGNALRRVLALIGIMTGLAPAMLQAGNAAWSTNAASGDWSNGANWNGGNAPGATTGTASPDIAVFSNASLTQITLPDANRNIAGFLFTNATCGIYTNGALGGNKLLLSSGGSIFLAANLVYTQYFNGPIELEGDGGNYAFTNASTKSLMIVNGDINGVSTTGNVTTLRLGGPGSGFSYGNVGDGPNTGKLALVINSGTWGFFASTNAGSRNLMTTTNTFSGGTTLNGGTLRFASPTTLGAGPLVINGGTLYNNGGFSLSTTNPMTWNANFTFGSPISSDLTLGYGPVTITTNITITFAGNGYNSKFTTLGTIGESGGSRSMTFLSGGSSPSIPSLGGSNTYSGGTLVNGAGVRIANSYALSTGWVTFTNFNTVMGNGSTLKGVSGMTWFGDFSFSATSGGIDLGLIPITMMGARTISTDNGSASVSGNITGLPFNGTNSSLTLKGTSWSSTFTIAGSNAINGGVTLQPGSATFTVNLNNQWVLGTGPFTMNPNTGVLQINCNSNGMVFANNNTQYWNTSFTFNGSTNLNMGTGPVIMGTNVILTVGAKTLTVGGTISASNNWFSLTKAGAGELVLGGANTYTGGTTVTSGRLTATGTLGAGSVYIWTNGVLAIQNGNAIAPSATLTLATNWPSCYVVLSNNTPNVIAKLIVGTNTYTHPGTYGSTNSTSTAQFKIAASLTGNGLLQIPAPRGTAVFFR